MKANVSSIQNLEIVYDQEIPGSWFQVFVELEDLVKELDIEHYSVIEHYSLIKLEGWKQFLNNLIFGFPGGSGG